MATTISATETKNKLSDILNRVEYKNEEFIIERQGVQIAKINRFNNDSYKYKEDLSSKILLRLCDKSQKAPELPKDLASNIDKYLWEEQPGE